MRVTRAITLTLLAAWAAGADQPQAAAARALAADSGSTSLHFEWLPGAARAVARTESASRDAPVFEYAYGPRAHCSIAGEWAWFRVSGGNASMRFGMYCMMGVENDVAEWFFPPYELWRGMAGFSTAWSLDRLAGRWLGPGGGLEASLVFGHESDHGEYSAAPRPDDIPGGGGGDFLSPDVALRWPVGEHLLLTGRLQCRAFLQGSLAASPGADIIARLVGLGKLQPIVALFGEGLFPASVQARDGYFLRALAGVAAPGRIGEVTLFASIENGNRKGLPINDRGTRVSGALRYAPFSR